MKIRITGKSRQGMSTIAIGMAEMIRHYFDKSEETKGETKNGQLNTF